MVCFSRAGESVVLPTLPAGKFMTEPDNGTHGGDYDMEGMPGLKFTPVIGTPASNTPAI